MIEVSVNEKPVTLQDEEQTGLDIKQAAIAQGVGIQLDFVLSIERGDFSKQRKQACRIEAGFPALEVEGLVGLFGIKTLPKELIDQIGADIVAATKDPAVSARLSATAQVVNPGGPAEFAAAIDGQRAKVATIAQTLGIKPKQP